MSDFPTLADIRAAADRIKGAVIHTPTLMSRTLSEMIGELENRPGLTGAHLLRHETPAIAQTTEQKIRATPDQVADYVLLVTAYDADALRAFEAELMADEVMLAMGTGALRGLYSLSHSAVASDIR